MIFHGILLIILGVLNPTQTMKHRSFILYTKIISPPMAAFSQAPQKGRTPPDTVSGLTFEQDKPRLDHFASNLKIDTDARAYVIVYGGRVGPKGEAKIRAKCIKEYLINKHGIAQKRVSVIDGGFRDQITVELFLLSPSQSEPSSVPTVDPSDTQVIKRSKKKSKCK